MKYAHLQEDLLAQEGDSQAQADFKNARRKKAELQSSPVPDRLPPHSTEAEKGVIGCCLLSPVDVVSHCIDKLGTADVFYDLRHHAVFQCLMEMSDQGKPIDLITVQQWLKNKNQLESVGGLAYLAALPDATPSAANVDYYIEIVLEKFSLRSAIGSCTDFVSKVYESEGDVDKILDQLQVDALKLGTKKSSQPIDSKSIATSAILRIEEIVALKGKPEGIPTGFIDLDQVTSGLKKTEMVVIAARPATGKTALAMNIADTVAVVNNLPVAVFSLEMSSQQLMMRMLCSRAKVSMRDIRMGIITTEEVARLSKARSEIGGAKLIIDDTGGLSIMQLRARARRYYQQHGIKLFIIDYLQLLHSTNKNVNNRQEEVGDIARGAKELAKELDVPVLILAQLNRDIEKDKPRKPKMSDLRESGEIENNADTIGLLYKPPLPEGYEEGPDSAVVNISLGKNRHGEAGMDIPLVFMKRFTKFENSSKIMDHNFPAQTTQHYPDP